MTTPNPEFNDNINDEFDTDPTWNKEFWKAKPQPWECILNHFGVK